MVKQILVHDVIFNLKGVFRKFLKDFLRRYLVNDCISVEPFDLSVYFLKSSFPISGFAKFVLVFIEIGVLFVDIQFNDNSVVVTSFLFKFDLEFLLAKLFHIFFGPRDDSWVIYNFFAFNRNILDSFNVTFFIYWNSVVDHITFKIDFF